MHLWVGLRITKLIKTGITMKNSKSRIFHGAMVGVCLFLCLMTIISLGSFAAEHNKIRKYSLDDNPYSDDYCILFTHYTGEEKNDRRLVNLSGGKSCVLAIWGEAGICVASLILGVEFLVKAIIGVKSISFFAIVELVTLVLTGLFSFAVAFVISVGLRSTCNAFGGGDHCSGATLYIGSEETETKFYNSIHAAEVTAWIATLILAGMSATYVFVLIAYVYTRKRAAEARSMDEMRDHLTHVGEGDEEPALVK